MLHRPGKPGRKGSFEVVSASSVQEGGGPGMGRSDEQVSRIFREKRFVRINGMDQGMFIESRDLSKPLVLFLHGGPGMPEYFLNRKYPTGLEEHFTVCWWERRGSGLSFNDDINVGSMTVEQMVDDIIEVTNHLRERFGKQRIILMAHSGGTFFGIQAVAKAPDLFQAYIAIAQMSYQLRSEELAYEHMLRSYRAMGNSRMIHRLERSSFGMVVPLPSAYMRLRDYAMHDLGIGTTHEMRSVLKGIFIPIWLSRDYTIAEKIKIWRGKSFSGRCLWDEMLSTDLTEQVTELSIPVYFMSGHYDHTVSRDMAMSYLDKLRAPIKGFYTFNRSAHIPMFEEPERFIKIMLEDVLSQNNSNADRK